MWDGVSQGSGCGTWGQGSWWHCWTQVFQPERFQGSLLQLTHIPCVKHPPNPRPCHSHIGSCCPSPLLSSSWSPCCNPWSSGASRWPAGSPRGTRNCSAEMGDWEEEQKGTGLQEQQGTQPWPRDTPGSPPCPSLDPGHAGRIPWTPELLFGRKMQEGGDGDENIWENPHGWESPVPTAQLCSLGIPWECQHLLGFAPFTLAFPGKLQSSALPPAELGASSRRSKEMAF